MEPFKYMVFFKNPLDTQLRELLSSYLAKQDNLEFVFCTEWEQNGLFIYLKLAKSKQQSQWGINVPAMSVLSIADFSEERSVGFSKKPAVKKTDK